MNYALKIMRKERNRLIKLLTGFTWQDDEAEEMEKNISDLQDAIKEVERHEKNRKRRAKIEEEFANLANPER